MPLDEFGRNRRFAPVPGCRTAGFGIVARQASSPSGDEMKKAGTQSWTPAAVEVWRFWTSLCRYRLMTNCGLEPAFSNRHPSRISRLTGSSCWVEHCRGAPCPLCWPP